MTRHRKRLTPQVIEDLQDHTDALEELDFRERREVRKNRAGEHRSRTFAGAA